MRRTTVSLFNLRTSPMRIGDMRFASTPTLFEDGDEAYALPLAGFSYSVNPNGFIASAREAFTMNALMDRRQLNVILTPQIRLPDGAIGRRPYPHTRYMHSHDVSAVATLLARNNRHALSQSARNTLRLAGLTHDRLTVPFGDLTKTFDPHAFDEDAHYPKLLKGEAWEALKRRHKVRDPVLVATINNDGVLGKLHDLADKIAYVARDSYELHRALQSVGERDYTVDEQVFLALLERNPTPCSLWESVTVVGDEPAFGDLDQLEAFLRLRIYMFRNVYEQPTTMAGKTFFAGLMRRAFKEGQLNLDRLDEVTDADFEAHLLALDPRAAQERQACEQSEVQTLHFEDAVSAEIARLELERQGIVYSLVEDRAAKKMKGATHLRVKIGKNETKTFTELRPEVAREIESSIPIDGAVRLTYLPQEAFRRQAA